MAGCGVGSSEGWVGGIGQDESIDTCSSSTLAEYGDFLGVAAEGMDVLLDPLEGEALV